MEEEEKIDPGTEKKLKAKTVSLISKIISVVVILGGHILKWCGFLPSATSNEICICGFAIMGIFGTVDLNILVDKFTKKGE